MDPFEPIRSKAAALHDQLVSEGEDPFDPLALVQAAVARRDLDLVWLPRGDPALKGARALYDDQGGTICCEEEADPVTRALLVAHELGHSELHAGSATARIRYRSVAEHRGGAGRSAARRGLWRA